MNRSIVQPGFFLLRRKSSDVRDFLKAALFSRTLSQLVIDDKDFHHRSQAMSLARTQV